MRNIKIGLIVIISLIAIWLGVVMVRGITGHGIFYVRNNAVDTSSQDMRLVLDEELALDGIDDIAIHQFTERDVVRHKLVQKIILAYDKYEKEQKNAKTQNTNKKHKQSDRAKNG